MAKTTVTFGPFLGGLNNATDVSDTIADNELYRCVDFDYTVDGFLVTRPAVAAEALPPVAGVQHQNILVLGWYITPSAYYLVALINGGLWYRAGGTSYQDGGTWTLIASGVGTFTAAVQYVDAMYFVGAPGTGGAKWTGPAGAYGSVASMPYGTSIALFKERLWVSSGTSSRLYFSNLGTGDTWSGSDFIDVNAGDGQPLTTVYAGPSALYLFKTSSTFVLTYDSGPTAGSIQGLSSTIGLSSRDCLTEYKGIIYLLFGADVYTLNAYTFGQVSLKVDLTRGAVASLPMPRSISTAHDRILVSWQEKTYVYYPVTNTWTEWQVGPVARWWAVPNSISTRGYPVFLAAINTPAPATGGLLALIDTDWNNTLPYDIVVADPYIQTKMYSLDSPERFKRLHWWGADVICYDLVAQQQTITLAAVPYQFADTPTWGSIGGFLVGLVKQYTWGTVLSSEAFSTTTTYTVHEPNRRYVKAGNSQRFSRIQFKVTFPGYRHTYASSINHLELAVSGKQDPVAESEGS